MQYIKIIHTITLSALYAISSVTYAAAYSFEWTYLSQTVSGIFQGTENGNRIEQPILTQLSRNSAIIDPGPQGWFTHSRSLDNSSLLLNTGYISFDGEDNNIVFANTNDITTPIDITYFLSFTHAGYEQNISETHTGFVQEPSYSLLEQNPIAAKDITNWRVSRISAVPEPSSIALMGLGFADLGYLRRRKSQA